MAHHRKKIVPFPGRFGRRQPPYTRLFRDPRRRLGRAARSRLVRWLVPWLPFLLVLLANGTIGDRMGSDLDSGLSLMSENPALPDAGPARPPVTVQEPPVKPVPLAARQSGPTGSIAGLARVIDGDTLTIGRTRIRLDGIDAPEADQTCRLPRGSWNCGTAATARLRQIIGGHTVICERTGTDTYGRTLARCRAGDADLAAEMVRSGLAMAYRQYSLRYLPQELGARLDKRNIWATDFMPPWEWRKLR